MEHYKLVRLAWTGWGLSGWLAVGAVVVFLWGGSVHESFWASVGVWLLWPAIFLVVAFILVHGGTMAIVTTMRVARAGWVRPGGFWLQVRQWIVLGVPARVTRGDQVVYGFTPRGWRARRLDRAAAARATAAWPGPAPGSPPGAPPPSSGAAGPGHPA